MFQTLRPRDDVDGSGLGMSIIKKLVEWQGGRVWIVSAAGERGTAIHFLWPKESQEKPQAVPRPADQTANAA
jgi:signal transduction histidine kinase